MLGNAALLVTIKQAVKMVVASSPAAASFCRSTEIPLPSATGMPPSAMRTYSHPAARMTVRPMSPHFINRMFRSSFAKEFSRSKPDFRLALAASSFALRSAIVLVAEASSVRRKARSLSPFEARSSAFSLSSLRPASLARSSHRRSADLQPDQAPRRRQRCFLRDLDSARIRRNLKREFGFMNGVALPLSLSPQHRFADR